MMFQIVQHQNVLVCSAIRDALNRNILKPDERYFTDSNIIIFIISDEIYLWVGVNSESLLTGSTKFGNQAASDLSFILSYSNFDY